MRSGPTAGEAAAGAAETQWERGVAWLRSPRASRALTAIVVAGSLFFVAVFLWESLRRLSYPYDLEWIESGILVSIHRIANGQPLYTRPTLDYVPYLYAPFYFYVSAAVMKLTGAYDSYLAPRLVSMLSALGTQALLLLFVRRESKSWLAGIASAGIYASLYLYIEGWVDIGRVDALFIFILLLAIYCTRFAHPLIAALVWVLAFQTKQSVLPVAIPFLLLFWERQRPMRVVMAVGAYVALAWASIAGLNHLTGGWYKFYLFNTIKGLPGVARLAALYPSETLLRPLTIAFAVIAAALLLTPIRLRSRRTMFYLVGSAVLYLAFWYVRAHRGYGNTMQAVYVWTLLLFGMAFARLLDAARRGELSEFKSPAIANALLIAVIFQLGSQIYNPGQFVPAPYGRADRDKFEEQLRAIPGDVYVVNHSWDAVMAGKKPHAEGEAVGAVIDAGGPQADAMIAVLHQATLSHQLSAIAVDGGYTDYVKWLTSEELAEYPVHVAAWGSENGRFLTSQPVAIFLPCSALANGVAARVSMDGSNPPTPKECESRDTNR